MVPYFLLFGIPICIHFFTRITKPNKRNLVVGSFFAFFIIILALRDVTCGADVLGYFNHFKHAQDLSWSEALHQEVEPGYWLLQKAVGVFSLNFNVFLTVVTLISLVPVWVLYAREKENALLLVILFTAVAPFSMYFSGLRQIAAMGLGIIAWFFVKKKRFICFVLTVLLAMTFHQSAFVLLLLLPAYYLRITKKRFIPIAVAMVVLFIFNKQVFGALISVAGRFEERYNTLTSTGAYGTLILLVLFAVYAFVIPDETKLDKDSLALRNVLILSICIQCFAPIHTVAMRMNYYFLPFVPLMITKVIGARKKGYESLTKISIWIMCIVFTGVFFYKAYTGEDIMQIFPYVPFWRTAV